MRLNFDELIIGFMGKREKVGRENFDESLVIRQISQSFPHRESQTDRQTDRQVSILLSYTQPCRIIQHKVMT